MVQQLRNKELRGHKESSDLGADSTGADSASGSDVYIITWEKSEISNDLVLKTSNNNRKTFGVSGSSIEVIS